MATDAERLGRHSRAARAALDEEYRLVEAESKTFAQFGDRIAALDVTQLRPDGGIQTGAPLRAPRRPPGPSTGTQILQAYRETVLSMNHYQEVYGEPLDEHMAAEFGRDFDVTFLEGSPLTPPLKEAVIEASQRAHNDRAALLDHLDDEMEALKAAEAVIDEIATALQKQNVRPLGESSFEELCESYERLDDAEEYCRQFARDRQRKLQADDLANPNPTETPGLQAYLYTGLAVTYPILADITDCYPLLERGKARVTRALAAIP